MDATHIHLALTHFPIIGIIIGIGIMVYGYFLQKDEVKIVALALFILMAFLTIPVYLSGEGAEKTIEDMLIVPDNLIDRHEKLAEKASYLMGFLGLLSFINLFLIIKNSSFKKIISLVTLIVSLGTSDILIKVGSLGGQIRHSEIRSNKSKNQLSNENKILYQTTKKEHD